MQDIDLIDLYGYTVCPACKIKLGLFQDKTIQRHNSTFAKAKENNPGRPSYEEEVRNRLIHLDKDYISKRIKLLHIQDRLQHLK